MHLFAFKTVSRYFRKYPAARSWILATPGRIDIPAFVCKNMGGSLGMKIYRWNICLILSLCALLRAPAFAVPGPDIEERIKALSTTNYRQAETDLEKIGEPAIPYLIAEIENSTETYSNRLRIGMELLLKTGMNSNEAFRFFVRAAAGNRYYINDTSLRTLKKMSVPGAKEAYKKLSKKRHDRELKEAMPQWMKAFPNLVDYDGVPLEAVAELYAQEDGGFPVIFKDDSYDEKALLTRVLQKYPDSKVAPLEAFFLYEKDDPEKLKREWGNKLLPSVASVFGWMVGGARVAPMLQFQYAIRNPSDAGGWEKFLEYYPDRLSKTNNILPGEWDSIRQAYYSIIKFTADGEYVEKLEDEVLLIPNEQFYDLDEGLYREPHPEVYLRKARRYAAHGKFAESINWSYKLIKEYPEAGWGNHGGGKYSDDALRLNDYLPSEYMVRLIDKLLAEEKPDSERTFDLQMMKIGRLAAGGKEGEAERLLKKLFSEKPQWVINTIDPHDRRYGIVWWDNDDDIPLRQAYEQLRAEYLARKNANERIAPESSTQTIKTN
jgi:hypothetical protein